MGKFMQGVFGQALGRYGLLLVAGVILGAAGYRLFAEKNTWAYFSLAIVGLVPLGLFLANRAIVHLFGLGCILLLIAGLFWLDSIQETDREQVLRKTYELLSAVERPDFTVMEQHLADNYTWQGLSRRSLLERARRVLDPRQSRGCNISQAQVQGNSGDSTLTVSGNLTASGQFGQEVGTFIGVIDMKYTRGPDGQYKLTGTRVAYPGGSEVVLPAR